MSYRPDACDAALLAWANACLQHHSDEAAPTLEAVVDTNSLSLMCKKFNLGDPEQGARRQSAAQRRRRVAEALNSCRVGLVEPSMAELGGPAAGNGRGHEARSLTAGILLVAVEAPTKEEAIQFIVTLDQSQQADTASDRSGDKKDLVDEKAADLTPRISVRNRRFSDVQIAGNDPKVVEPLQAEAHELRRTLDRHTQDVLEKQQVQLSMADKVAEAKALLCGEADRCVDLFQELDAKETEHRSLSRDLVSLKEEMRHENAIASNHSEALKELSAQVEEERRRCRSIQMRQIDLKAEVDQAHHSVARVEASSWKRTALQAKLTRFSWQDGIEVHQDLQDLELREQPNLLKTDLCFRFMRKGRCSKGTSCTFAHGREELRVATQHEPERVNSEPMKVNLHRALEAPLEERALSVLDPAPLVPPGMSMVPFRPPPGLEEVLPPPSRKPPSLNDLDSLSLAPTSLPCTPAQSSLPCTPGQSSLPCTPGQYSLPCTPGQKGQQSLRREHGLPSINSESVYSA
ncbi:Multidrug and toxin extrusion protein 1 [Durusdinium trenchii]|uniref:Multidrug and toxin extrusion protein 1 n=1 Tax=Durusdinium trenchii TaxID=1381693 RepID=A0ABP0RE74_9DINO